MTDTAFESFQADADAGSRTLSRGSAGSDVQELQRRLNGFNPRLSHIPEDGYYTTRTHDRVRYVQIKSGIEVDGIAGPNTWAVLGKESDG